MKTDTNTNIEPKPKVARVAIIHDWLNGMRGGEKVLEEILELFPGADIYTLFLEADNISEKIRSHRIFTSSLNRFSFVRKRYKHFLPLFPAVVESFDLSAYDLVISTSHCVAKGVVPPPDAPHISYVHSPMRYAWDRYYSYFGNARGLKKLFIRHQVSRLRGWDVTSSARVDHFIANSRFVRRRIMKYYRREATVIHPPVDTEFYSPTPGATRDYFLAVSALVPYKENHLLVAAFNQCGEPLIIVGKGPEEKRLKRMAGPNITFKKNLSAGALRDLYRNAAAYVFAGIEDFGISFVEAQACGTPVIAYKKGGVLDIVTEETGVLFPQRTTTDIINAVKTLKEKINKSQLDPSIIRQNSLKFSREHFKKNFQNYLNTHLKDDLKDSHEPETTL